MAEAKLRDRPLSPHLQIYRWTWTMAMSIAHRVTGGALYFGTILVAAWLLSMASGPAAFERAQWFFGSIIGWLILFVYTYILMQHMIGGIRHLIWDFGYGMEPGTRMNMARGTLIAAALLTSAIWVWGRSSMLSPRRWFRSCVLARDRRPRLLSRHQAAGSGSSFVA